MHMARSYFLAFFLGICLLPSGLWAQSTGQLYGTVYDDINGEVLPFAEVLVDGGPSAISDVNGDYRIEEVPVGLVDVSVVFIGYEGQTITEVRILGDKATKLDAYLTASTKELDEVVIQGKPFEKIEESPLSVRVIGTDEIERFPGGNRDVSRVIQSLPGVSTGVSYRNDIIVRGGSPNENRFYID
ncbi:MAG TPA: ferric aerobactin receptor, partial [Bacteroidetes bacterium]|nr:ferric aerobactin receptor [Bacteroidota bacterium]